MSSERPSHPICASVLGIAMAGLKRVRREVVPQARGHVLELGVGTGLNFPFYDFGEGVTTRVSGIEPDHSMLKRAQSSLDALDDDVRGNFELNDASAEELPYEGATFDTVVATFVLCTIPRPAVALAEARRVLKPNGVLLFAEHVLSSSKGFAKCQHLLDPVWGVFAGGCHLTRNALELISEAGFVDVNHRTHGNVDWTLVPIISGTAAG